MHKQPQLMSRSRGKTLEFGYLLADELDTIYLDAEGNGGRYGYADAALLAREGWSEHTAEGEAQNP